MVALKTPKRAPTGSYKVGMASFKKLVATCENPPKANKALRDFVSKGERLLKKG